MASLPRLIPAPVARAAALLHDIGLGGIVVATPAEPAQAIVRTTLQIDGDMVTCFDPAALAQAAGGDGGHAMLLDAVLEEHARRLATSTAPLAGIETLIGHVTGLAVVGGAAAEILALRLGGSLAAVLWAQAAPVALVGLRLAFPFLLRVVLRRAVRQRRRRSFQESAARLAPLSARAGAGSAVT
jgi:hypothetical protein